MGTAVGLEHYRIFHNTATYGPFDSAMATLLDLPVEMTINALGNAGTQAAGLWQFLESGAMSKHLHAGRAAEAGLVAADPASRGFFAGLAPADDPEAPIAGCTDRKSSFADGIWQLQRSG